MSTERKNLELTVGLFLFIGFAIIATLVVVFGRVGQGFQKMYTITVEFPNAGGLIKGSDVLLSGVRIGMTKKAPAFTGQNYQAEVELSIKESAKIPRQSVFEIHTNGMLGDSFIDVTPPAHFTPADFAADGERIVGKRAGGFEELTTKGSKMIDTLNDRVLLKVSDELDEIKVATKNINAQLLTARNMKNLEDTLANLKKASNEFSEASQKLNVVAAKVGDTVDSAKTTLKTVEHRLGFEAGHFGCPKAGRLGHQNRGFRARPHYESNDGRWTARNARLRPPNCGKSPFAHCQSQTVRNTLL